jgi:hypothetical protein
MPFASIRMSTSPDLSTNSSSNPCSASTSPQASRSVTGWTQTACGGGPRRRPRRRGHPAVSSRACHRPRGHVVARRCRLGRGTDDRRLIRAQEVTARDGDPVREREVILAGARPRNGGTPVRATIPLPHDDCTKNQGIWLSVAGKLNWVTEISVTMASLPLGGVTSALSAALTEVDRVLKICDGGAGVVMSCPPDVTSTLLFVAVTPFVPSIPVNLRAAAIAIEGTSNTATMTDDKPPGARNVFDSFEHCVPPALNPTGEKGSVALPIPAGVWRVTSRAKDVQKRTHRGVPIGQPPSTRHIPARCSSIRC